MRLILIVPLLFFLFLAGSCQVRSLAKDEKYSSDYLKGKIRITRTEKGTTHAELRIKNHAKRTSYRDMGVALQCYSAKGDSICYTLIDMQTTSLKPRKKQKYMLVIHCEKQRIEAITVHYINGRSEKPK